MMLDDVDQGWQQKFERGAIVGAFEIAIERVEKPQRRVGGVIQALVLADRETCLGSDRRARNRRKCARCSPPPGTGRS